MDIGDNKMIELNQSNFEAILKSNSIVIIDFWATWCKPCYTVEQILMQLEAQYNHSIKFAKLNTDEHLLTARKYNVLSLPTVIIFKNQEPVKRIVGSKTIEAFEDAIEEIL